MTGETQNNLQAKILNAIKKGEVIMRPRWHFVLKTILGVLGGVIVSLVLVYLISLIIFGLRETGILFAPGFGFRGVIVFLQSLPWLLILLVGVFLIVLELLVQKYSFAYRRPLLYSAFAILAVVIVTGWVLTRTPLHGAIMYRIERFHVPVVGQVYRDIREPVFRNAEVGKIIFINPHGFDIENPKQEIIIVTVTPATRILRQVQLETNDYVMVIGNRIGNQIEALGVREIPPMK